MRTARFVGITIYTAALLCEAALIWAMLISPDRPGNLVAATVCLVLASLAVCYICWCVMYFMPKKVAPVKMTESPRSEAQAEDKRDERIEDLEIRLFKAETMVMHQEVLHRQFVWNALFAIFALIGLAGIAALLRRMVSRG